MELIPNPAAPDRGEPSAFERRIASRFKIVDRGRPGDRWLIDTVRFDEERQPVLPIFVDTGEKAQLLRELKEELKKKYQVSFFTTPEDLSKRIAQDLPSVLEGIGVQLEPESPLVIQGGAEELLKRFWARPAKYAGREITVSFKVTGDVKPVSWENQRLIDAHPTSCCRAQGVFARDSPLEEAVSSEPVSGPKFPASWENTGNFIDSGLGSASTAAKKGMKSVPCGPIPYAP